MALLAIASRVEAAVRSYISVQAFTDADIWRENFIRERVSTFFRRNFKHNPICYRKTAKERFKMLPT
jgi:hypothetical protein